MIKKLQKFPVTIRYVRIWANEILIKTFPHQTFCEYRKSSKKRPGCLFNHWNFRGSLLEGALKQRGMKKLKVVKH